MVTMGPSFVKTDSMHFRRVRLMCTESIFTASHGLRHFKFNYTL